MPDPFVILSLPRSRSAWLSRFLTYGDWVCGHEELRHWRSVDDARTWLGQPCVGTAETAGAPWWRLLGSVAPGARVVVVRRPVHEVLESLALRPGLSFDLPKLKRTLTQLDHKLGQIEKRLPGVVSVRFGDLDREDVCAALFEHCLPYRHDSARWKALDATNVQINLPALFRYYAAFQPSLEKFAKVAKHQTIAQMRPEEGPLPEGLTIQVEDFETWRSGGRPLFEEHCVLVGEAPDEWERKNIPLMRVLDAGGAMQITTARCNGRMFGYLVTLISPSLAETGLLTGTNTTFYASPQFPGLGMKLQRAAVEALKARGVARLYGQAGVRGSGRRIGAIYRRLGAESDGEVFCLDLRET